MQYQKLLLPSFVFVFVFFMFCTETVVRLPMKHYFSYFDVNFNSTNISRTNGQTGVVIDVDSNELIDRMFVLTNDSEFLLVNSNETDNLDKTSVYEIVFSADENSFLTTTAFPNTTELVEEEEEGECTLPKLNPLDPTILDYLNHPPPFRCGYAQPPNLFTLDNYGYIWVNETYYNLLAEIHHDKNFTCMVTTIDKMDDHGVDINRTLGSERIGNGSDPYPIRTDAAEVDCTILKKDGETKEQIYYYVFGFPRNITKTILPTDDKYFSVQLLFTDSTSLSMFQRTLNKTFEFLTDHLDMYVFPWFNKVADNSFPNLMPLVTGKRVHAGDADQPNEFGVDYGSIFWDNFTYIWKNFSAKGYATSFNEDKPNLGLFHYLAKGFRRRPVDHYYHSFWWALRDARQGTDDEFCFRNKPRVHIQLDVLKREVEKYKGLRHFAYVFQTELSHDSINDLAMYDDYYLKYFQEYSAKGYFDDKILFILSDHGHRFSGIRSTLVGTLEERLPMMGIIIPPKFRKLYPEVCKHLEANQDKLVTHFDLHETLVDISEANYAGKQRNLKNRNLSLLYPIPRNRTCKRAGIPKVYCTCKNSEPIDPMDRAIQNASVFITDQVNNLLEGSSSCVELQFQSVLYAQRFENKQEYAKKFKLAKLEDAADNSTILIKGSHVLRIAFDVTPSEAKFEAMVKYDADNNEYEIEGDINRLNKYGNQSYCVTEPLLRKYCFCRGFKLDQT